jgi:multidrug efflux pump
MLIYAMLSAVIFAAYLALPSSFIPEDDQGYFMTSIQLPSDATQERTRHVVDRLEKAIMERPGVASNISIFGFGFSGSGPNTAMAFTTLKEWGERQGATADGEAKFVQTKMNDDPAATVMSLMPPAISDMGTSSGFDLYLEDRAGRGFTALLQTASELTEKANNSGVVSDVYIEGLPAGVSATLEVDREKAQVE